MDGAEIDSEMKTKKEFTLPSGTHQEGFDGEATCWYDVNTQMNHMRTTSTLYALDPNDTFDAMVNTAYGMGYDINNIGHGVMLTIYRYAMEAYGKREPQLRRPEERK